MCDTASAKSCFDCEQQFCTNHIYSCADCGNQYCGDCLDAHHADGHWTDSDTAFELAAARGVVRSSSANLLDLHPSGLTRESISLSLENSASNQQRQSSRPAIPDTLEILRSFLFQRLTLTARGRMLQSGAPFSRLFQRLTRRAAQLRITFQNVALQAEAGL